MSDVKIGVDLSELKELLELLKDLKAIAAGGTASGAAGATGTASGAIGGQPTAQPSVPASALSPAAGGVVAPPGTATPPGPPQPANPAPPPSPLPPKPPQPEETPSLVAQLAKAGMITQAVALAGQMGRSVTSAMADGRPSYLAMETSYNSLPLAGMLTGAYIGSAGGPVGTLAGAGIGLAVGAAGQAIAGPAYERQLRDFELHRTAKALGYIGKNETLHGLANPIMEAYSSQIAKGRYLTAEANRSITDAFGPKNADLARMTMDAVSDSAYSPGAMQRYGLNTNPTTWEDQRKLLLANSYGNEFEYSKLFRARGDNETADKLRSQAVTREQIEGARETVSAERSLNAARAGYITRYGSPDEAYAATAAAAHGNVQEAKLLRAQAEMIGVTPSRRDALLSQAAQLELDAQYAPGEAYSGSLRNLNSSKTALGYGRADRAFGTALYGGTRAENLPWGERVGAAEAEASRLGAERESIRKVRPLSEAEENDYRNRIDQARYNARIGIAKEREDSINSQRLADADYFGATVRKDATRASLYGSYGEQATSGVDAEIKATQERLRVLQQILDTSKMLTAEQRTQLQTQVAALEGDKERLAAQRTMAEINSMRGVAANEQSITAMGSSMKMLLGPGGLFDARERGEQLGAMQKTLSVEKSARAKLIEQGYNEKSEEVLDANRRIKAAELGIEQQRSTLAHFSPSHQSVIRASKADTMMMAADAGLASYGQGMEAAMTGIRTASDQRKQLEAQREYARSQSSDGKLTDLQERTFNDSEQDLNRRMIGYAQKYNEGWQHRLINEAFNAPSTGRLAMSQFNARRANLYGATGPWLGGTEEQTRGYREQNAQIVQMTQSGNLGNQSDRFLAQGDQQQLVKVVIEFANNPGGAQVRSVVTDGGQTDAFSLHRGNREPTG